MRFVVFCIVIILSAIFCPRVYSIQQDNVEQKYFNFILPQNVLKDGQEIKVEFSWNIKDFNMADQKRLTVRPFISAGAVEIYNQDLGTYVGNADFNTRLPYLQKEILLRFKGVQSSENPISLHFVIYDTLTGLNYSTPTKNIWGTAYYKKYTDLLNENLLKDYGESEESAIGDIEDATTVEKKPRDPPKIYLWYLSPAFFLYGLLKSHNGSG